MVKSEKLCERLDKAYAKLRTEYNQENYIALMEAFESDLRDDAYGFNPVAEQNIAATRIGGQMKFNVLKTPHGPMVALFTSREQVEKHPAPGSIGVKLSAFLKMVLANDKCAGIVLNACDGHHGVPVDRRNLEILSMRVRGQDGEMPKLNPGVVSDAVYRLWGIAVGVPTAVYDVKAEVEKFGGMEKIMKPVLESWNARVEANPDEFSEPMEYLKAVLADVVSRGFVYGAMALQHPEKALEVDVEQCIDSIPDLRGDIRQNVDQYLVLVSDAVRSDMYERNEEQLQLLLASNTGIIAIGAFNFGLGWGMAKNAESQGVEALADLRDRQQAWIEDFKNKVIEKMKKAEEKKQ